MSALGRNTVLSFRMFGFFQESSGPVFFLRNYPGPLVGNQYVPQLNAGHPHQFGVYSVSAALPRTGGIRDLSAAGFAVVTAAIPSPG